VIPAVVRIVEEHAPGVVAARLCGPGDRSVGRVGRWVAAGLRPPRAGRQVSIAPEGRALPHRVHAAEPVVHETGGIAPRACRPEAEVLADISRHTGCGQGRGGRLRAVTGEDRQGTDAPGPLTSDHLGADVEGNSLAPHQADAATEEGYEIGPQVGAERELIRTFDEEVAFLRVEERES